MAEQSTHSNYTFEEIQRYLQGKMSAAEMHEIEKAALQDAFLADAIEGYRDVPSAIVQQHLNEINAALSVENKTSKVVSFNHKTQWLRIAAIIILLAGVGVIGTYFFKASNNQHQIAQVKKEDTTKKSAEKDSVETVTAETASVNKNSAPLIAENKKQRNIHSIKKAKANNRYRNADTINKDESNAVASLAIRPEQNTEANKTFSATTLSAQKTNDSTQYVLQGRVSGLNIAAANTFAGKVIDENKKPVPGAMVQTNDKRVAVVTDLNGNFSLQKNDSFLHVQTTAVGYENKNVLLKPDESNLITIEPTSTALNDVVVTGYGTQKKKPIMEATPVGGWQNFNNYVLTKLNADSTKQNYLLNNDIVELEFLIDDEGNPYNIQITKPLDDKRNSEAVDILKSGPKWTNTSKKKKAKVAIAF